MAGNVVNVGVLVKTTGLKEGVDQSAQFATNMERVNAAASRASKAIVASSKAAKSASNASGAPTGISSVTDKEYAKVRGGVGTGAAGRDFAKQSQGLGGVVGLYATFAANIFAVGAAFEALNKAAAAERLAKATEMMSVQVGVNLKGVSKNLIEASGHALSFQDAMQFTNIGTSAGLAGKQIESLTKIARGAASALGRDVNDSIRRIIQGTAKQEQEILDELGIFVKSKIAFDKYAQQIGVKVDDLTGRQRTQAYANEVERLGTKWKEFAEIDDPFSRFTATGKNALNELLAGVNSVFKPILSFLSESKSGIQAIIALVTITLTKRALPELGGLFNNIFNYDKQLAATKAQEILADVRATRQALAKEMLATKAELDSISKAPIMSKESLVGAVGALGATKGNKKTPGIAGISTERLTTSLLGSDSNPKDLALLKSKEVVETRILTVLNAQVASKASSIEIQEAYIKSLVSQGVIEQGSSAKSLILSNKSKDIASKIYNISSAQIGNEAKKIALAETLVALKKEEAYQAEREVKAEQSTEKGSSVIPRKSIEAFKVAGTSMSSTAAGASATANTALTASTVASTVATQAHTLATNNEAAALAKSTAAAEIKTVANANLKISANLAAEGAQNITNAFGAGFSLAGLWNGIKQTGIEMKTQYLQMKANTLGLGQLSAAQGMAAKSQWILSASWIAGSGAAKALGMGIKGLMGALNMLLMPLMVLMTVWTLFGDKLSALLPDSVQAALGIGKVGEAAKAAEEKQKAYNDSLEVSTKNLAMLADMKASGKIENLAEEADLEERIARGLKERISLITQAAEAAKAESEANKRRAEDVKKWGKDFSEAALNARELANVLELANQPELAKQAKDIANEYNILNTNFRNGIIDKEEYAKRLDIIKKKEDENLKASSLAAEQRSSSASKASASLISMEAALEKVAAANKKLGNATQGLKSGEAVDFYNNFSNILDKTGNSATGVASMFGILGTAIAAGGKTAALAIPIMAELAAVYRGLIEANVGPQLVQSTLSTYIKQVIDPQVKALSNSVDTGKPKDGGKIKEYAEEAKAGFRSIENEIKNTKLQQLFLDKQFANTSALQKRNDSLLGYQSAETNALEKSNELRKNEAELLTAVNNAHLTLRKTLDSKTRSSEEKSSAIKDYAENVNLAAATKDSADQNAELTYQANSTTTALGALTKSYELLDLQQANSAAQRIGNFDLAEREIELRNELAGLSEAEIVRESYAATLRKATFDQTEASLQAQEEYNKAVNKVALSGATDNNIAKETIRLMAIREEKLVGLAIKYNLTREAAEQLLAAENQKLADKSDWTKGAIDGLKEYEKSAMDVAGNTQQMFSKAFKGMEDALTDFVMTGKLDFASLANSIIADMVRIAIQQSITGPLAKMAMAFFAADGAAFSTGGVKAMAKGGAYEQGTQAFAKGGTFTNSIVSSPTLFKFAQGTGLMGEAGPEAIMPLKRDSNGTLGVRANVQQSKPANVTINIVESAEKAGTQERRTDNGTDMITIFVEKVKSAIASDISRGRGAVPGALSKTYGLNRVAGAY